MDSITQQYLQRSLKGDVHAYGMLMDSYQSLVYVLVRKVCGNAADAEELTQDVFLKAYQQLNTFKGTASFATWLYRIAFNTAVSGVRKKQSLRKRQEGYETQVKAQTQEGYEPEKPFAEASRDAQLDALQQAVDALCPEDRLLIELYYYKELQIKEVAYIAGLTESNAKVRIHRIRQRLGEALNSPTNGDLERNETYE